MEKKTDLQASFCKLKIVLDKSTGAEDNDADVYKKYQPGEITKYFEARFSRRICRLTLEKSAEESSILLCTNNLRSVMVMGRITTIFSFLKTT